VSLLAKNGVNVSFESDKIIMTKKNIFVKKGYFDQGLFILNISKITNYKTSSFVYLIDSYDIWHARLWQVNSSYVNKLKSLGMITLNNKQFGKCDICLESKLTKKKYIFVQHKSDLLSLIHTDLGDLKQIISRGGNKYYIFYRWFF